MAQGLICWNCIAQGKTGGCPAIPMDATEYRQILAIARNSPYPAKALQARMVLAGDIWKFHCKGKTVLKETALYKYKSS